MSNYRLSRKAISDLDAIWDYSLTAWSEEQAVKYYNQLHLSVKGLSSLPEALSRKYDMVKPGLCGYHIGHHIIFYKKMKDGTVLVDRILHEKMDFPRHL